MDTYDISVITASGIEAVAMKELKTLGFSDTRAVDGSIKISGTALDIARLNMFLRTAERVRILIGTFPACTFDMLFEGTKSLVWESYIDKNGKIIVNGKSKKSALFSIADCQSIIKKALVSRLAFYNKMNTLPESGCDYNVEFIIENDVVSIYLDTSGKGLHKRGYRDLVGVAPLKETIACALLYLSDFSAEKPFIDPFCGSGTIVIEAARMALNIASGINRTFDFAHWEYFDKNVLTLATAEAKDIELRDKNLRFAGFDIDPKSIALSLRHAERAGIRDKIHLQVQDVKDLRSRFFGGTIVTNPPYGERMLDMRGANELYKVLGEVYRSLDSWSIFVLTSAPQFEKFFGQRSDKNRKFYNANKECHYYSYNKTGGIN